MLKLTGRDYKGSIIKILQQEITDSHDTKEGKKENPKEKSHKKKPKWNLKVCPSSCPLHWWCHPVISSSDALFSFCPQSFLSSGSFPMSWLFTSGGQNTEASDSASVFPMSIQGWFPIRLTGFISLQSKGLSGVFSDTTVRRNQFFDP